MAFAKQMTDEGRSVKKMCRWHIFSVGPASYAGRVSPDRKNKIHHPAPPHPPLRGHLPPIRGKVIFISANTNQHTFLEKRDAFKTRFFFPREKETGFGIQRKRGSLAGQVAPNRDPAARLYAPVVVRPRPRWTTWAEQGKPVVLSHIFSPPAPVGLGAWRRRLVFPLSRDGVPSLLPIHSSLFPLPFLCGARRLGAPLGSLSEGAVAKWRLRESKTFPP